jgi:hypothetical protein
MPEVLEQTQESLGWRAGLPDDLKSNEAFKEFKTVGDFAKHHLSVSTKAKELEGKIQNYVPKLADNATDEQKNEFYTALGRPKQPSEYEFDGEDKNAPEWTNYWKQTAHSLGLNMSQAKALSTAFNAQMTKMVETHNANLQKEVTAAEGKLKSELGDKFDTSVELAKRLYQKHLGTEFDKAFTNGNSAYRFDTIRLLLKFATLTGEDRSPQGGLSQSAKVNNFVAYDKSPAPPKK